MSGPEVDADGERDAAHWRRARRAVHRNLPDGVLLLAPGMAEPLALTGPGSLLWDLLGEGLTRLEISVELARTYGATAERVDADLADTWQELIAARIVEPVPR